MFDDQTSFSRAKTGDTRLARPAAEATRPVEKYAALAERGLALLLAALFGEPLREVVDGTLLVRAAVEVRASVLVGAAAFLRRTALRKRAAFEVFACWGSGC